MPADGAGKLYLGQCVNTTIDDPTTPSSYTWTLIKGADGQNAIVMTSATTPSGTYVGQLGYYNGQFYRWTGSAWELYDAVLPADKPLLS